MEPVAEESPGSRGTKRIPSVAIAELDGATSSCKPAQATPDSSMGAELSRAEQEPGIFLSFCKECGEQYRIFPDECERCGGCHPVASEDVVSWLDEVKEREAFDKILGKLPGQIHPSRPRDDGRNHPRHSPPHILFHGLGPRVPDKLHCLDVLRAAVVCMFIYCT